MRPVSRKYPFLVCALLLAVAAARAQTPGLAAQRATHLRRGINTSMWFAQSPNNYSVQHLRTFTTSRDLALIHTLGFDHIRLSVDPDPLTLWQQGQPAGRDFLAELDNVVTEATSLGLAVIIDIHPESHYKQSLLQDTGSQNPGAQNPGSQNPGSVQAFVSLWRALAAHFRDTDPALVFFEIMNEPEQPDTFRWQGIQTTAGLAIREVAPRHTLIASGAHWSGLDDLLELSPLGLDNVIYTFHDYEPFAFTHQGATWTMPEVRPLRGVPYPSTPENIQPLLSQEPALAAQQWLAQYGQARWNAAHVDRTLALAEQWSRRHNVPIYCGEFGVYKAFAPPADRALWLHDMRVALEAHSIGWAMWDYQADFGLVTKHDGVATPDPALVDALGLKPPNTAPTLRPPSH